MHNEKEKPLKKRTTTWDVQMQSKKGFAYMNGLVEGRAAYWQQRWSTTKEVKHLLCVHGKWRKAADVPDGSTHVQTSEEKERVAGTWNQTSGASLLGFGQSWPWALLLFPLPSALLGWHQRAMAAGQGKKLGEMCKRNQGASSSLLPSKEAAVSI